MTMDYNKWGVVTGIAGLVMLLVMAPLFYMLTYAFNQSFVFMVIGYFSILLSIILGIAALIFGVLSIWMGDKKKTALILGIIYILLWIVILPFFIGVYEIIASIFL